MGRHNKSLGKVMAAGALIAASAGYLTGVLTAPKSGKETREDIAKKATKARTDGEKQLKKLHSELNNLVDEGEKRSRQTRDKATDGLKDATEKGKVAKEKARDLLSALHNGDADDPNLQAVIEEVKMAKNNLVKFLKK